MPERIPEDTRDNSFRGFLSAYRNPILIILVVALAWRIVLAVGFPRPAGDEPRYTVPAINMLAGRGFSSDVTEPILPSVHTMPLYPLFIAAIYAVFGVHNSAVRIAQSGVDLITCLLVAFVSFSLAPASQKRFAAISALIIYAYLSWFTVSWTRYVLTETLAIFFTMLAIAASIIAFRNERWRWIIVGLICGAALLVRADSVLLVLAFCLFLIFQIVRLRRARALVNLFLFSFAIPVVLTPWIVRNYVAFGKFEPLASSIGMPRNDYVPNGYIRWTHTWMSDETNYHTYDPFLHPGQSFDPHQLPSFAFDSDDEREKVFSLIDRYNQEGELTPELSDKFQVIADERIKRAPLRFFVWLPLRRIAGMWLTGFATANRFHRFLRMLFVLPIIIGGLLGFAFWAQNRILVQLLALIVLTRTLFFGFISSEERYIVECYPLMIAACGVSSAILWNYVNRRWLARRPWPQSWQ
jgi:4-amino-4-deoxy-L-arabinose transferase-like glycosyltransferase